jgi:sugar phosphate isomerase/epimerase
MAKIPVGLQLYTLRDLIKTDFVGTVKEVAKLGYAGVELAGFGNLKSAAEVRNVLDDVGLRIAGNHVGLDALEQDVRKVLDEQDALGHQMITVSWLPESRRKDAAAWRQVAASFMRVAPACVQRGFTLAYHNHSFEFQTFDGKTGFDILWENTDPSLLKCQLDVYWVKHGNRDPVGWIHKLANRLVLLHLKDMEAGKEQRFAPVGTGVLDFKSILAAADQIPTVRWHIVEQDSTYDTAPLDAVRTSLENLRKLGAL